MNWEEVRRLGAMLPPRGPRGDPKNKERCSAGARWGAARRQYHKEHGVLWDPAKPPPAEPNAL